MKRVQVPPLTGEELAELEEFYRKTTTPRYRTRAQMSLLSTEKGLKAEEIAEITRESHITVLRWLKCYITQGIEGLKDTIRPGRSTTVTEDYRAKLEEVVRRRPRSLPSAGIFHVVLTPIGRLLSRRNWAAGIA